MCRQEATTCHVVGRWVNLKRSFYGERTLTKNGRSMCKIKIWHNFVFFVFFLSVHWESLRPWNLKVGWTWERWQGHSLLCKAFTVSFLYNDVFEGGFPVFFSRSQVATLPLECMPYMLCSGSCYRTSRAVPMWGFCWSLEMYIQVALGMPLG